MDKVKRVVLDAVKRPRFWVVVSAGVAALAAASTGEASISDAVRQFLAGSGAC